MRVHLVLIAFAVGVWLLQQQAVLPDYCWVSYALVGLLSLLALSLYVQRRGFSAQWWIAANALVLCFVAGWGYAAWRAEIRLADQLPSVWEGQDIQIIGVIDELPKRSYDDSIRFAFAVEEVLTADALVPQRVSLAWYPSWQRGMRLDDVPDLRAAQRWQLVVRLKRPHGNANPHGFDYEAWLLENNLRATGYVRKNEQNKKLDEFAGRAIDYVQRERERIRKRILTTLNDRPYAGVISALAVGDQRAIPQEQWTLFNRMGIGHLISISGLHVTLYATLIGAIIYWLWRRSHRLTSLLPARKAAALIGALAAIIYVLLAGFAVPAQRTLYMLLVAAAGLWLGRPGTASVVLCWALLVVLLTDPWAVLAPGFWLSFSAVALLIYVSSYRLAQGSWWAAAMRAQLAVTLGLLPLMLALFQQVSLISPLANAIAIPLVSFFIVPLVLLALLVPSDTLLLLAHDLFAGCAYVLKIVNQLPSVVWEQHAPPGWTVFCGIIAVLWLLSPRGLPAKGLACLWLLPMFLVKPEPLPNGALRMTVLDVGQGLSVFLQTRQHALLYDTGPRWNEEADSGNRIIAPYLRGEGIRRLDGLMVSHNDLDHSGGARSVLQSVPVQWLASSLDKESDIVREQIVQSGQIVPCYAGQNWRWDEVHFQVLHPTLSSYENSKLKTNDRSCVLKISTAQQSILLAADIEARSELELLQRVPDELSARILLVPHHGSKTSSLPVFVDRVRPDIALIAVGYRNRFGHPKSEVIERYEKIGTKIYRTDYHGAIELRLMPGEPPQVLPYREHYARYWREMPQRVERPPIE